LGGCIFKIGINGSEDGPNECPTHLIIPEMGGKTSVDSISSLTFDWIVCVSFTFLSKVLSGFAFSYLY